MAVRKLVKKERVGTVMKSSISAIGNFPDFVCHPISQPGLAGGTSRGFSGGSLTT